MFKRSVAQANITFYENKPVFESDIAALTKSAELFADQAEKKGDTTLIPSQIACREERQTTG